MCEQELDASMHVRAGALCISGLVFIDARRTSMSEQELNACASRSSMHLCMSEQELYALSKP